MPTFTSALEDTCPPLVYSPEWQTVLSENDTAIDHYTLSSYAVTQAAGATMTFQFIGTGIGIYGANRPGYGLYQVSVDGQTFPTLNASSATPRYNQTLFNATLKEGSHTVVLTNLGNTTLDVDYVSFDATLGETDDPILTDTYQDTDPTFEYIPASSWVAPARPGTFSGSSGHITGDSKAVARHTFKVGDAIFLYGPVGPDQTTSYNVRMNGGAPSTFSAYHQFTKAHQVLYFTTNLGLGTHTLEISFDSTNHTGLFSIDFSNIYTAPSVGGHQLVPIDSLQSSKLSRSVIAGLSVSSAIAFLALGFIMFLLFRRRRGNQMTFKAERKLSNGS